MSSNRTRSQNEIQSQRETARGHSSSEVLAILAPTSEEPKAILRSGFWKTGTLAVPEPGSAA